MDSHGGLRGIASVVIMMQHVLGETRYRLDSNGSSMLPLFFMLSGFSMAVVYGRKPLARNRLYAAHFPDASRASPSSSSSSSSSSENGASTIHNTRVSADKMQTIDAISFYQNRIARVMPTYYLCAAITAPVAYLGCLSWETDNIKGLLGATIMAAVPVASILNFFWEIPINGPGWTVQTLLYFWLLTPVWLPEAQRLSNAQLVRSITRWYYVQLVLVFILYPVWKMIPDAGQFGAIGVSTMSPLSRFPLFLMGIDAGMLCQRYAAPGSESEAESLLHAWPNKFAFLGNWLPSSAHMASPSAAETSQASDADEEQGTTKTSTAPAAAKVGAATINGNGNGNEDVSASHERLWGRLADASGLAIFVSWFVVTVLDSALRLADRDGHDLNVGGVNLGAGLYTFLWYQAIDPFVYLTLIVAVTRDGGKSVTSRLMRTRVCQFLGRVSMAVYLVHMSCIGYLKLMVEGPIWSISGTQFSCWLLHGGPVELPDNAVPFVNGVSPERIACEAARTIYEDNHKERQYLPAWGIGVVPVMAIIAGYLILILFEEPLRRMLRKKK